MNNTSSYRIEVFLILIIGLVLISPIFAAIKMASTIISFFIFLIYLQKLRNSNFKNYKIFLITAISILITSIIPALIHSQYQYLTISFFFLISLFILLQSNKTIIIRFVELASNVILFLNIGAIIGFVYAFIGGPPIITFANPNGLVNYVYFTTMTNSVWGNFIRPSAIYDEPGAFSFFITGIATARHFLNLSPKKTWVLLLTGIITFSVAHIIYIFFYLLSKFQFKIFTFKFLNKILLITFFVFFTYLTLLLSGAIELVDLLFLSRFKSDNSGLFPGDNRSDFFFNAYNFISQNPKTLIFGQPINENFNKIEYEYGNVGANPLMPILRWGIFGSWPYYFILFYLIIQLHKGKFYFPALGFALILFQREFFYVVSYSLIILLIVIIIYFKNSNEEKNTNSFWH
jgi:hypothetical protein